MSATIIQMQWPKKKVEFSELMDQISENLLDDWERMIRVGKINDYVRAALPLSAAADSVNYLGDLNALSNIEIKLGVSPMIFFPGTAYPEQLGWIIQLNLGKHLLRTPELASEASARAFGILLYLRAKHEAQNLGLL